MGVFPETGNLSYTPEKNLWERNELEIYKLVIMNWKGFLFKIFIHFSGKWIFKIGISPKIILLLFDISRKNLM